VLIVPTVELPPVTPFTFHVTDELLAFFTVAVNCNVVVMRTFADVGEMVTLTVGGGGLTIVAVADANLEVSATLVA
jgi:hypothetical protein